MVYGVWNLDNAAFRICHQGLFSLQHRGQEGAGIAINHQGNIHIAKGPGLVMEALNTATLPNYGQSAIGNVHYSTSDERKNLKLLPLSMNTEQGELAISFSGKLTNHNSLRAHLIQNDAIANQLSDAELILQLIINSKYTSLEDKVCTAVKQLEGSFTIILMSPTQLVAIRDPLAIKPLCLGQLYQGQYIVASESCAIDSVGATFIRDLSPGEILVIDKQGLRSSYIGMTQKQQHCIFEYVYLARPNSTIDNINVWSARYQMGKRLAKEKHFDADIVVPVPSSGIVAARGYAEQSKIPFIEGIIRNQYAGRTFILPYQNSREEMVRMKLAPIKENLKNKRVILVDDSLVRGTTMKHVIAMLRECGVKSVFLCLSSPQIIETCKYGVDMATYEELISANLTTKEIEKSLGCDGIHFISIEGLLATVDDQRHTQMCTKCFGLS